MTRAVQLLLVDQVPVEAMRGLRDHLIEELALRPTNSLPEGVRNIGVVVQVRDLGQKAGRREVPKSIGLVDPLRDMLKRQLDVERGARVFIRAGAT